MSDQFTVSVIPSSIVTSTAVLAGALRWEPMVQVVLEPARQVDAAVVGVGSVDKNSRLVNLAYLTSKDAESLAEFGLVGVILGPIFTVKGEVPDLPINERRIGLRLAELGQVDRAVCVVGERDKVDALRGAYRGGLLDVLITGAGHRARRPDLESVARMVA